MLPIKDNNYEMGSQHLWENSEAQDHGYSLWQPHKLVSARVSWLGGRDIDHLSIRALNSDRDAVVRLIASWELCHEMDADIDRALLGGHIRIRLNVVNVDYPDCAGDSIRLG